MNHDEKLKGLDSLDWYGLDGPECRGSEDVVPDEKSYVGHQERVEG